MKQSHPTHGYYMVSISAPNNSQLIKSNGERAFIISQLQDVLSPRSFIRDIPASIQVAVCIDLLSYSIRRQTIELLAFSIDIHILRSLSDYLLQELEQYQDNNHPVSHKNEPATITIHKLRGPHHALAKSIEIHSHHDDWEYDRYSSIGFYLHDRRGSWMRIWRLAELYGNKPANYLLLMHARFNQIHRPYASSS